jgi:hypothetical protein
MGNLPLAEGPDRAAPSPARWAALQRSTAPATPRAAGLGRHEDRLGVSRQRRSLEGFSIDGVLGAAQALAARVAVAAPDLSITVHDPRESLRAWFGQRSDPRAFALPRSLGGALAARYAASPGGADQLHLAQEMIFALDAVGAEPAAATGVVRPPSPVAAL